MSNKETVDSLVDQGNEFDLDEWVRATNGWNELEVKCVRFAHKLPIEQRETLLDRLSIREFFGEIEESSGKTWIYTIFGLCDEALELLCEAVTINERNGNIVETPKHLKSKKT